MKEESRITWEVRYIFVSHKIIIGESKAELYVKIIVGYT